MLKNFSLAAIALLALANAAYAMDRNMNAISREAREEQATTDKMHHDMMQPYTNNPDQDFVRGMIPHHQGAVDMAKIELQYGTDPELRKLAQSIIDSQEKQIKMMKNWLTQHDHPSH